MACKVFFTHAAVSVAPAYNLGQPRLSLLPFTFLGLPHGIADYIFSPLNPENRFTEQQTPYLINNQEYSTLYFYRSSPNHLKTSIIFNGSIKRFFAIFFRLAGLCVSLAGITIATANADTINRQAVVSAFSPQLNAVDKNNPFTLGNGKFAFTADVTGFQSFGPEYYAAGFPLETKARWAWHSKGEPHTLDEADEEYDAYDRKVKFPTRTNTPAAQWLRQNPHDLPLGRISLMLDGKKPEANSLSGIKQTLDLWKGELNSRYLLAGKEVAVKSAVHANRDGVAFRMNSSLNKAARLSIEFGFPRGYDFSVKNTPDMDWLHDAEHSTSISGQTKTSLTFRRKVDDQLFTVLINWRGNANLKKNSAHTFELTPASRSNQFEFTVEYVEEDVKPNRPLTVKDTLLSASKYWQTYWQSGTFVDLSQSTDAQAQELQRRILLSQYLLAAQTRDAIPAQETGLTSSSWYGKFHTEMSWLHYAHWIMWNRSTFATPMLDWYLKHMDAARAIAQKRGLQGTRWPKMTDVNGRESPGGNPLIIWNQPQPIHLAELLFQTTKDKNVLERYSQVVEETALAMSSMLSWDKKSNRFVLNAPIWIAQEIYTPTQSRNPAFELAYWRYGLETAQQWRIRQGLPVNRQWQQQLELLADLPQKDGKYVAIESIPDTFDNPASREDHPTMLAPAAFLNDAYIDKKIMSNTLAAVIKHWAFDTKIWGWDYPMLAMTAARLEQPELAVQLLLMESKNNHYLINGNCPQMGADLPVYLPANASLLTAVAIMLEKNPQTGAYMGLPNNTSWTIHTEGF